MILAHPGDKERSDELQKVEKRRSRGREQTLTWPNLVVSSTEGRHHTQRDFSRKARIRGYS
jgi:hypothetical protein